MDKEKFAYIKGAVVGSCLAIFGGASLADNVSSASNEKDKTPEQQVAILIQEKIKACKDSLTKRFNLKPTSTLNINVTGSQIHAGVAIASSEEGQHQSSTTIVKTFMSPNETNTEAMSVGIDTATKDKSEKVAKAAINCMQTLYP